MKRKNKKRKNGFFKLVKKISLWCLKVFSSFYKKHERGFWGVIFLFLSISFFFSIFSQGEVLKFLTSFFSLFFGKATLFLFFSFFLLSLCFFISPYQNFKKISLSLFFLSILSLSGFFGNFYQKEGGKIGNFLFQKTAKIFGPLFSALLFFLLTFFSFFGFYFLIKKEKREINFSFIKRIFGPRVTVEEIEIEPEKQPVEKEETKEKIKEKFSPFPYTSPPPDLLEKESGEAVVLGDLKENAEKIKNTLLNFGIEVQMGEINVGPTVTQYTLKPAEGVKLSKISSLSNNLSLVLAAHPIRIEAPIPGKSLVGIEVPNKKRIKVRLRDFVTLPEFKNSPPLTIVMGKDVVGNPVFANLAKMPHLLVAGATGTGKTIFLNSLILSLLYKNSPQVLRLLLVDPKKVEFSHYQNLPHLLGEPITDLSKVVLALDWLTKEMEERFEKLAEAKSRDIFSFNQKVISSKSNEILPFIILIIDELADLMISKGREIEIKIVKMAQLARAVGIHLVLATQRPSTDVVTGLIKANITSRVAFQVASQFDSRTILDTSGAEKLLGLGDLLFISAENIKPKRIQGVFISEKEVKRVIEWFEKKYQKREDFLSESLKEILEKKEFVEENVYLDDPLYEKAREIVIRERKASASFLQRRMKIGYARAGRLIDLLEKRGVISPPRGSKPREILIKEE